MRSSEAEAETIDLVRALGDTMDPDPAHTEAVRAFAMRLFDELRIVHNMADEERFLLECASLLHDIGWSRPGGGHHISSMELILNDQSIPLNTRERYMVASMARYHNSLPKARHYNYSVLSAVDRRTVLMAASILRLADSLDASHQGAVELRSVMDLDDRIVIRGVSKLPSSEEVYKFAAKKDLFERTFRKGIDLELQRIADRPRASSRSRRRPS
jgi:exopolyphosphatase/guanosine-5'-triphosphate,3'-diphosphate pyrophosphatase